MQRNASRSHFPAEQSADGSESGGKEGHWLASWTHLVAIIVVLASRGLASAADPDNVLLDFTATWCGPCQQMSPIVSRLERQGFPVRKVDVDQEPDLAAKYKVGSIPTFVLVSHGQEVDRVSGITTEQQLRSMVNRLPKAAPLASRDNSRPDVPSLGRGIPITPESGKTKPPRKALPIDNAPALEPQNTPLAAVGWGDDGIVTRGQNTDPNPLRSSVRIRVKDGNAINYGSGTIIESQPGLATILTCGHIFRRLSKSAVVEIDVYATPKAKPDTVTGRVLLTDLESDVGLVRINFPTVLSTVRISQALNLAKSDRLFSIGCSGGDNPSREEVQVTSINKYDGPDNLECSGRPQKGRSGGGLFRDDELVGVCIAADPQDPRGIYTALKPIGILLEKAGLNHLLPRPSKTEPTNPIAAIPDAKAELTPDLNQGPLHMSNPEEFLARELGRNLPDSAAAAGAGLPDIAGAEVICIVRSKTPGGPSQVIVVNQASARFVADLLNESSGDTNRVAARKPAAARHGAVASQGVIPTSFRAEPYHRNEDK